VKAWCAIVRPSPAAVFGATVGAGLSAVGVWIRQVPSRGVGSKSRNGWIGGLTTQRLDPRLPQD